MRFAVHSPASLPHVRARASDALGSAAETTRAVPPAARATRWRRFCRIASARAASRSTRPCPPRRACCARTGAGLCTRSARTGPCARLRRGTSTPPRGAPWTRATPRRSPRTAGAIGPAEPSRRSGPTRPSTLNRGRCACPLPAASPRSGACGMTPQVRSPRRAARSRWFPCGRARNPKSAPRTRRSQEMTRTTRGARACRFWRMSSTRTTPCACCARSGTPTATGIW